MSDSLDFHPVARYIESVHRTHLLINGPFHVVRENLPRITALGVGVEVFVENNLLEELDLADARTLGREMEERGIVCTFHGPFMNLSPGGIDRKVRAITQERLFRAVEVAHAVNARGMVCHPDYDRWRFNGNQAAWLDNSVDTWTKVLREAGNDLPLFMENVFEEEPSTLVALLDVFRDRLWHCFDTGHFNLFSKVPLEAWLLPLEKRLREFHIHDNHGTADEHLPVGEGSFPFRELKQFLRRLDGVYFTAEARSQAAAAESVQKAKEFLS